MPAVSGGILVVGGCGLVGHLVAPRLTATRISPSYSDGDFRYYSFEPDGCSEERCPWVENIMGDVTDIGQVFMAARSKNAILFTAMGSMSDPQSLFEVGVRGWYNCLLAAKEFGIRRVVLISSVSVYDDYNSVVLESEDRPRNCDDPYGVVKVLAEDIGKHFAESYGMSVIALRIAQPKMDLEAVKLRRKGNKWATSDVKLAEAICAALSIEHTGFDAIHICQHPDREKVNMEKAKRVLGWEPA